MILSIFDPTNDLVVLFDNRKEFVNRKYGYKFELECFVDQFLAIGNYLTDCGVQLSLGNTKDGMFLFERTSCVMVCEEQLSEKISVSFYVKNEEEADIIRNFIKFIETVMQLTLTEDPPKELSKFSHNMKKIKSIFVVTDFEFIDERDLYEEESSSVVKDLVPLTPKKAEKKLLN